MPFQSEKQRRYLHANHPEIAKRWERDYAHGGILDINESKEIIDDGGNEIELTDYNAAFDDPNDLSTGVKSLFRAKDGGRIGFFTGAQADTAEGKSMSPGTSASGGSRSRSGGDGGYQNVHQTGAVSQTPGRTTTGDRHPEVIVPKLPPQLSGKGTVTDAIDLAREDFETKKAQLEKKLRNTFIKKILGAFLGGGLTIGLSDLKTAKTMYDLSQIQKDYINLLENAKTQYKKQGLPEFNPHVDTAIQTLDQEILDLTQRPDKDEDTKGDGPQPILDPVTLEVDTEYAQGYSDLDRIRAGQAKRAMLVQRGIIQDNPIVDESITDITMQANKGGLANLFRVKKQ